jgi:hypothetical protein
MKHLSLLCALLLLSLVGCQPIQPDGRSAAATTHGSSPNPQEIESMLIAKEQEKWRLFSQGDFDTVSDLYRDDFLNLGWTPTGMVLQNKAEMFAMLAQVPSSPGEIALSDFHVVHGNERAAVVTYKVTAPFGTLFVSSVWAEQAGEWETVFYQASAGQ